jgi:predicted nucleic acid-binding protein
MILPANSWSWAKGAAVIILDANIIVGLSLRSAEAELLRAINASGVERIAVPWLALEEVAAQQAIAYSQKHQAAVKALEDLRKASQWTTLLPELPEAEPESARQHWPEDFKSSETVVTL